LHCPAIFTNPRPCFQERDLPAGKTTIVDEFIAYRAAGPPAAEQRRIPVEALFTNLAMSRLNPQEHRLPFAARFSDAHGKKYSETPGGKTSEGSNEERLFLAERKSRSVPLLIGRKRFAEHVFEREAFAFHFGL
jgi:hypothetical protein